MTHQLFDYLDKEQERLQTKKSPVEEKEYRFFEEVTSLYETIDNALEPAVEKSQLSISEASIGANRFNLKGKLIKVYGKKPIILIPDVTASQRGDYKVNIQSGSTILHSTYFFFDSGKWKSNRHEFGGMKKAELDEQAFLDILLLLIR